MGGALNATAGTAASSNYVDWHTLKNQLMQSYGLPQLPYGQPTVTPSALPKSGPLEILDERIREVCVAL